MKGNYISILNAQLPTQQRTLFQQHFSVKYLHRKPIGFILVRLIFDKNLNGWQLCEYGNQNKIGARYISPTALTRLALLSRLVFTVLLGGGFFFRGLGGCSPSPSSLAEFSSDSEELSFFFLGWR